MVDNTYKRGARNPGGVITHLNPDFAAPEAFFTAENKGFAINGKLHLTRKDNYEHMLLVGATGVGKSTKVIVPTLAKLEGSMVIHDPSKELFKIMKTSLESRGYEVLVLNFSEPGWGYNPLNQMTEASDVHYISELLVSSDSRGKSDGDHWTSRAGELIGCLIHLVIAMDGEDASMARVRKTLLQAIADPARVEELFKQYANEEQQLSYLALTKNKTNELASIFSTASAALKDFSNTKIADVVSRHDIDLGELRKRKTALFIQNDPNRSKLYNKVNSLVFEQLWLRMMEDLPQPNDLDLYVILEEAAALNLRSLPEKIDKARKYRIGILIAVQSLQQLSSLFGDDSLVIEDNCKTHIYLGAQKGSTAKRIEEALGKVPGTTKGRFRLPKEKSRMLNKDTIIMLCNGLPPIITQAQAYYDNPDLAYLTDNSKAKTNDFSFDHETSEQTHTNPWDGMDEELDTDAADNLFTQYHY